MEEKLRRLMKQEGLNSTRLAEMLGIQASGISHIMSGRNKPSYDFIVKLLHRFPQLNPDWLLTDKGPMYRDEIKNKNRAVSPAISSGLPASENEPVQGASDLFSTQSTVTRQAHDIRSLERDDEDIIPSEGLGAGASADSGSVSGGKQHSGMPGNYSMPVASVSTIERIVVLYKDKTFTEYRPE